MFAVTITMHTTACRRADRMTAQGRGGAGDVRGARVSVRTAADAVAIFAKLLIRNHFVHRNQGRPRAFERVRGCAGAMWKGGGGGGTPNNIRVLPVKK